MLTMPTRPNIRPTFSGCRLCACSANSVKQDSIIANAKTWMNVSSTQSPTTGCRSASTIAVTEIERCSASESGWRVSGSKNSAKMKFSADRPAAIQIGVASEMLANSPPMNGPIVKPMPNAAPIMPMPRARFSRVVRSATQACAIGMLAVITPCSARKKNNMPSEVALANPASINEVMPMLTSSIGRRPKRSESCPQIGAAIN